MTALPRHLTPALEDALSENGRYNARKIAAFMDVSLRELADITHRDVSVLSRNPDGDGIQANLRPLVTILDLISKTGGSAGAVRKWLRSPIPGLGYRVPLQMIKEGDTEEIIDTLTNVLEGIPG